MGWWSHAPESKRRSYMNSKMHNELAELTPDELDRVSGGMSNTTKQVIADAVIGLVVGFAAAVPFFGTAVVCGVGLANSTPPPNKK